MPLAGMLYAAALIRLTRRLPAFPVKGEPARRRDPGAIADRLKEYREREARRRGQPHYTILKDDTIGLIAEHQPTDLGRLRGIKGVGPSTLELHGATIIEIVRGA